MGFGGLCQDEAWIARLDPPARKFMTGTVHTTDAQDGTGQDGSPVSTALDTDLAV